jgi:voltage-gated potassium channel
MAHVDEPSQKLTLPRGQTAGPAIAILKRVAIAVAIVLLNWGLVVFERDGYTDAADGKLSIVDALYYTTVTLSTTGYGDITPVTTGARLTNALLVTPMRFLFVLVLVGTTIQVLTERSRDQFRVARWRSRVNDHVIVCGYGTKGRSAVRSLVQRGLERDKIVVIETDHEAIEEAQAAGLATVHGSSTSDAVLKEADVAQASAVIIAVNRDDTAVLTTLTVRQLAPNVTLVAAVREAENADLLHQSGASSVITSSDAAGRLLGLATHSPATVEVVEDLIAYGRGLDLLEREVRADEVGSAPQATGAPVLAVVRAGRTLSYDDPEAAALQAGDRIIYVAGPSAR